MLFLLSNWKLVVMGLLLAAASFFYWRAGVWQDKYYTFVAETKAVGEAQERATAAKIQADKLLKDTTDAEHAAALLALNGTINKLRNQRSNRSYLSPAAPGSGSPEVACLNRADADRAIRDFVEAASGLVAEGDEAILGLNSAKKWAQGIH